MIKRIQVITAIVLAIISLLLLLFVFGCRCVSIKDGSVWACGVFTDVDIDYVQAEPNLVIAGQYASETDDIQIITPYGAMETK